MEDICISKESLPLSSLPHLIYRTFFRIVLQVVSYSPLPLNCFNLWSVCLFAWASIRTVTRVLLIDLSNKSRVTECDCVSHSLVQTSGLLCGASQRWLIGPWPWPGLSSSISHCTACLRVRRPEAKIRQMMAPGHEM